MLVLSRKFGQKLVIARNIVIQVVSIKKDRVVLGITAPKDVRVDRQEVFDRIRKSGIDTRNP